MAKFLIRRVIFLVFTLFAVSIAVFAISELAPGDIAVNVLGNTITEDQKRSFNAQHGLDQPIVTRYVRWMFGSDWQAEQRVGYQLRQVYDPEEDRTGWWAVGQDGTLFRNFTPDGETLYRIEREIQPDGTLTAPREVPLDEDAWVTNDEGDEIFWGVDPDGRAAMWIRGAQAEEQRLTKAGWLRIPGDSRRAQCLHSPAEGVAAR